MAIGGKKLAAFVAEKSKPAFVAKGGKPKKSGGVDADVIGDMVQNGKGDKGLMRLAKGITEETNPPGSIEDEDIWEKAKASVEPKWDDYDEPYAVVMHVYKAMGGKLKGGKE